jgi:hypothetical protein
VRTIGSPKATDSGDLAGAECTPMGGSPPISGAAVRSLVSGRVYRMRDPAQVPNRWTFLARVGTLQVRERVFLRGRAVPHGGNSRPGSVECHLRHAQQNHPGRGWVIVRGRLGHLPERPGPAVHVAGGWLLCGGVIPQAAPSDVLPTGRRVLGAPRIFSPPWGSFLYPRKWLQATMMAAHSAREKTQGSSLTS